MSKQGRILKAQPQILILAFSIAFAVGLGAITAALSSGSIPASSTWAHAGLELALLSLALIGTFANLLAGSLTYKQHRDFHHGFAACVSAALLLAFELFHALSPFSPLMAFLTLGSLNAIYTYHLVSHLVGLVELPAPWPQRLGLLYALSLLALRLGPPISNVFDLNSDLEAWQQGLGLLRELLISSLPLVLIFFAVSFPDLRVKFQQGLSLRQRFVLRPDNFRRLSLFYTACGLAALLLSAALFNNVSYGIEHGLTWAFNLPLQALSLSWAPLAWAGWEGLNRQSNLARELRVLSSLTSFHARRFILRYGKSENMPATAVGMRTVSFTINHDPGEEIAAHFPQTLCQIRQEEILRCTRKLLGSQLLLHRQSNNQLAGTIDPELSRRPCVSTLAAFAALYLDGIPLVERRLRALSSLFPIIDPILAERVKPEQLSLVLSRVEWLYYFDYDWVDQQISAGADGIEYSLHTASSRSAVKQRIMLALNKQNNRRGTYVWVGERARDRLLLEAPYLASLIEAWPVKLDADQEQVIFLMKFEDLIPRLQRYYSLESFRAVLKDYEPTGESRRFVQWVEFQLNQAKARTDVEAVVSSVAHYYWSGFSEKDLALRLLLRAHEVYRNVVKEVASADHESMRKAFAAALERIGYPSQMQHSAHAEKMRLRATARLIVTAAEPEDSRYGEAWLFLATADMVRYPQMELVQIVEMILAAIKDPRQGREAMVRTKAFEAFFNCAQHLGTEQMELLGRGINLLGCYLAATAAGAELSCLYLDAKLFLEEQCKESLRFEPATMAALGQYFSALFTQLGPAAPDIVALGSRWRALVVQEKLNETIKAA